MNRIFKAVQLNEVTKERDRAVAEVERLKTAVRDFLHKTNFIPPWESAAGEWAAAVKRLHDSVLLYSKERGTA